MNVSFSMDPDDKQVLAMYVTVREGEVYRTVEIFEGACYVDEDGEGNLLGVEMLAPGQLKLSLAMLSKKYKDEAKSIEEIIHQATMITV